MGDARKWEDYILCGEGNVPVILTAGHGGRDPLPGVPERVTGYMEGDQHTNDVLTQLLVHFNQQSAGQFNPYHVMARGHRCYCDLNRPLEKAMDSPEAKPYYELYHNTILSYIRSAEAKFHTQHVLVIDIHGQSEKPEYVLRGTNNGATVADLIESVGDHVHIGEESLFGMIESKGYNVFPDPLHDGETQKEHPKYNGGFTVRRYSGVTKVDAEEFDGVSSIQIEIGAELRKNAEVIDEFARDLARSIQSFCGIHILSPSSSSSPAAAGNS